MSTFRYIIPLLLAFGCRTTDDTKEKTTESQPNAALDDRLLQKVVDGISQTGQIYDCSLMSSDVTDADEIRKLIAAVPRGEITNVAYYIRAREPSLEIYAYEKGVQIALEIDHQTRARRDDPASLALIKRLDQKCPTPVIKSSTLPAP